MPTYETAERSQRASRPIVLYTFTTLSQTYRVTTHAMDVTFGDQTFKALTISHEDEQESQEQAGDDLVITLPISHPLVQRFAASGIPEQSVRVTVQTLQSGVGAAALTWTGDAQSISCGARLAWIRVPSLASDALKVQLPIMSATMACNAALFDSRCAPAPGAVGGGPVRTNYEYQVRIAAISSDGMTVTVDSVQGKPDQFFRFGSLESIGGHVPDGETRGVVFQVGTTITLAQPFVASLDEMQSSEWRLVAGCDHTMTMCASSKFQNRVNFQGASQMNAVVNPWVPNGMGVIQQV